MTVGFKYSPDCPRSFVVVELLTFLPPHFCHILARNGDRASLSTEKGLMTETSLLLFVRNGTRDENPPFQLACLPNNTSNFNY